MTFLDTCDRDIELELKYYHNTDYLLFARNISVREARLGKEHRIRLMSA